MDIARTACTMGHKFDVRQISKSLAFWFLELLVLAGTYGVALASQGIWEMRNEFLHAGLAQDVIDASKIAALVAIVAVMNFIWTGYIVTSLLARFLCVSRIPNLYPIVLASLVVVHITIIRLVDHGWDLTISYPLFVGWGAAIAFAAAWLSIRLQNSRTLRTSNAR